MPPSWGDLPNPGIEPRSSTLQGRFLTTGQTGKCLHEYLVLIIIIHTHKDLQCWSLSRVRLFETPWIVACKPLHRLLWLPVGTVAGFQEPASQETGSGSCQFLKTWTQIWAQRLVYCIHLPNSHKARFKGKGDRSCFSGRGGLMSLGTVF